MSENIISHNHNSTLINQRYKDGYINLTAMAQAEGKLIADYLRLDSTKAFLDALSADMGIPISATDGLVQVRKGGSDKFGQGTWGHPQVAIHCGQWCSPAFAVLVTRWVMTWITTEQNPLQSDLDRMVYRDALKDEARLRMTDQIKEYLEQIEMYDNKRFSGQYFARVHNRINVVVTSETALEMKERLSELLGRKVKDNELIRDYFPALMLQRYISVCEATANLIAEGQNPLDAVERARAIVLARNYIPQKIDFIESMKFVRQRVLADQQTLTPSDSQGSSQVQ
jgi:KilA-N domain